jgi:acetylornithine deacetylase/succinyl-diaminopimelate desuccinylase-like protein
VEVLDDPFPATPIVVGRLRGGEPGPTIVLNGHLDTVPIPHDAPRVEGGRVWGRGSADMKGPVAAATEAVRVLAESGRSFPGEVVLVAIGLHEAPGGRGEDLTWLLGEHGFAADYAIVCELAGDRLVAAHMGQATVEIEITREGIATHELQTAAGTPNPILVAARVIEAVRARNEELSATEHPWVGAETYFFGEVHGGDFYNRHPASCRLVGTRRWAPGNTLGAVQAEYDELVAPIAAESGCAIDVRLKLVRDAYSIDPDHPLAVALREGYEAVTGEPLEVTGVKVVADGAVFQAVGGIPTVYHGPRGEGAHADVESIAVEELVRSTEIYLATLERLWAR